jgi:predicted nucleic acid-binding protein
MIVADTSALISLSAVELFETTVEEFDVHTTKIVVEELEQTSEYEDSDAEAAKAVLEEIEKVSVHPVKRKFESSRIDSGEGSCVALTQDIESDFLITDDLRALPELQKTADSKVAISPILLKALVKREILDREEAVDKLDRLAERRKWLGSPIYRRAKDLF